MSFVPNRDLKRLNPMSNDCSYDLGSYVESEMRYNKTIVINMYK